ncbi:hypothetical protein J6T21_00910 [Candidatus Saccharibacteria bacterium]|nr:hypothetical protein [Candidatus Saccharibacteria bacterium]
MEIYMIEHDNGFISGTSRILYKRMEDAINALKEMGFNKLIEGPDDDCLLAMGMKDRSEEAYIYLAKLE